jgi:TPR repeat protein
MMRHEFLFKCNRVRTILAIVCLLASSIVFAQDPVVYNKKGKEVNPEKVYKKFIKDANKGDAYSQKIIGDCFFNATGGVTDKDYSKAVEYYRKAAEQGYVPAQYSLAVIYDTGNGQPQDFTEAVMWYSKAAEQGIVDAQYRAAVMYEGGIGVAHNMNAAAHWYEKAAEQGIVDAQYKIARCYESGNGVSSNYGAAAEWYLKAANQGHAQAQNSIGYCYENGKGVAKNLTTAFEWYSKAANQEITNAQYKLGLFYEYGEGVTKDLFSAFVWYRKAADKGLSDAQYRLGYFYKDGIYVIADPQIAAGWYRKAAEQGNTAAQYELGNCYYSGKGVEKDYSTAISWFLRAAEHENSEVQYSLAVCYYKGNGVSKDLPLAVLWAKKASEQGNEKAKKLLEDIQNSNCLPFETTLIKDSDTLEKGQLSVDYNIDIDYPNDNNTILTNSIAQWINDKFKSTDETGYTDSLNDGNAMIDYYLNNISETWEASNGDNGSYDMSIKKKDETMKYITYKCIHSEYHPGAATSFGNITQVSFNKKDGSIIGWNIFNDNFENKLIAIAVNSKFYLDNTDEEENETSISVFNNKISDFELSLTRQGIVLYRWMMGSTQAFGIIPYDKIKSLLNKKGLDLIYNITE